MSSTISSNSGDDLWHRFLRETSEQEQVKENAYQCPWTKGRFANVTEYADMVKFEKHGAHVMLWCPAKETDMVLDKYPLKYRITMQIRFDGKLGFPGGEVDEMKEFKPTNKTFQDFLSILKKGLVREIEEEMMLKMEAEPKYIYSSCSSQQFSQCQNFDGTPVPGYILHFFSCQVPIDALESMEKNTFGILSSDGHGGRLEVLGITRVPLYFMRGNVLGLPSFLTNSFCGNAMEELMKACIAEGLLTEQEVRFAYYAASTLFPFPSK